MRLDKSSIKRLLTRKGAQSLYHANTVQTCCSFMSVGGILSREGIENAGLSQTYQYSDSTDKDFGIWGDIFLDAVDIHARANRANRYGPILFQLSLDLLDSVNLPDLFITKDNPIRWQSSFTHEDKYFTTTEEFDHGYNLGDFSKTLTLRYATAKLPFENYLQKIIIDSPDRTINGTPVFEIAKHSLLNAAEDNESVHTLEKLIVKRHCFQGCNCNNSYAVMHDQQLKKLFLP